MSTAGLCQVCESAPATHTCDRCGTLACQLHFEPSVGLCTECARTVDPTGRNVDPTG